MSCSVSPSGSGVTHVAVPSDLDDVGVLELERCAHDGQYVEATPTRSANEVRELTSETNCCCAWLRAALRVRIRLPAPAMTSTRATRPTMASIRRRRIGQPNR